MTLMGFPDPGVHGPSQEGLMGILVKFGRVLTAPEVAVVSNWIFLQHRV